MAAPYRPLLAYNGDHHLHDGKMNENAGRVRAVVAELRRSGRWGACELLQAAPSADTLVELLHSARHLAELRGAFAGATGWFCPACTLENTEAAAACDACGCARPQAAAGAEAGGESATPPPPPYVIPEGKTGVYLCARSLEVALANCALCVEAARRVVREAAAAPGRRRGCGFALVRPPGHHASAEAYGSYCLLNTVAVTARALLSEGLARRVLVLDWDVHHGDGTQAAIAGDATLAAGCTFVSVHRHDADFWPKSGAVGEAAGGGGGGGGSGGGGGGGGGGASIVNVPLRGTGYGDADYFRVFERVVLPLAARERPDAVLVSAGYDCAAGDMLGRFDVSSPGFGALTRLVLGLAGGAHGTLLVLEGGYDVDGTAGHRGLVGGVCASIDGLREGPMGVEALPGGWRERVRPETEQVIEEVLAALPR